MVCIYCEQSLAVINSRPQKTSNTTWRRRRCDACGSVFTTVEQIDLSKSLRVARPNGLEPFFIEKLTISLYESLKHRKTAQKDAVAIAETVTNTLLSSLSATPQPIQSSAIRGTAITVLSRFDTVAALHYEALHK